MDKTNSTPTRPEVGVRHDPRTPGLVHLVRMPRAEKVVVAGGGDWAPLVAVWFFLLPLVALFAWGCWFIQHTQPDRISLDPLDEITPGLNVVSEPDWNCTESSPSCSGYVVVSSGDNTLETARLIADNAEAAGFTDVEDHPRPWAAERGCDHLNLYLPEESGFTGLSKGPADALTVSLDYYCDS